MRAITILVMLIYNIILLGGAAYLVEVHKWSPWWMFFALLFFFTLKKEPH